MRVGEARKVHWRRESEGQPRFFPCGHSRVGLLLWFSNFDFVNPSFFVELPDFMLAETDHTIPQQALNICSIAANMLRCH
jgi:hypothetical protein